jgi:hypothetical protein
MVSDDLRKMIIDGITDYRLTSAFLHLDNFERLKFQQLLLKPDYDLRQAIKRASNNQLEKASHPAHKQIGLVAGVQFC